jgi:transposase
LKKRRYTEEFKKEAVRYIVIEGESVASVAKRLGVSSGQLYKWKSLYLEATEPSKEDPGVSLKDLAAENEQLRKKLRRSERINEILKKTVGYISQDEL